MMRGRPVVGISAYLLGERVRYDAREKRATVIIEGLSGRVEWLPVCPEVGAGLGVPRPAVRLVGEPGRARAVGVEVSTLDVTERLLVFAADWLEQVRRLDGFILKSRSPSCGLHSTPHYPSGQFGAGLFADQLRRALSALPLREESELVTPEQQESFLAEVIRHSKLP
ncbi:2-thiouracil desulfurase family protein [endosymbiont of Ridgeia piscesae]|jgi:uncharacterized protein YbbK (DUF523 family)|uniref:Uncharacterized protein n=2 Tax=endosymbiont of Ridgeia piscesae TaxID=54398 RepID=A0A0T5Z0K4_9GAMM|nr:DUF523 domain-containing protein [endosymbiont of Ridgeia piscesae]KRT56352.1 hypothetical protein Ga0074115_14114 [endosymbiont of Ridgeia piscesae]